MISQILAISGQLKDGPIERPSCFAWYSSADRTLFEKSSHCRCCEGFFGLVAEDPYESSHVAILKKMAARISRVSKRVIAQSSKSIPMRWLAGESVQERPEPDQARMSLLLRTFQRDA